MTWGLDPGSVRGLEIGHTGNLHHDEREALQFFFSQLVRMILKHFAFTNSNRALCRYFLFKSF